MMVGQSVGPFRIDRELGSGAMGSVYCGVYTKTGQRVAVKVMLPSVAASEQSVKRFEREYAILKQLNHPHIVRLFGHGRHQGMPFYAMEFVEGEGLDRVLEQRGRLPWEEVVPLGQQLCDALSHAHKAGVVHRDLKPSNLMILSDGTLKLTDFGIAKDLDVTQLTEANCTVGTASYMSPEQCRGDRNLTHKSDLYSLGIVFYELLTGKKPFTAENVMDMFMQHVQGEFERPSRLVPEVPKPLDVLVCQLMEKKPEQRPIDAGTVGQRLAEVMDKVEARASAGADAARRRVSDRLAGEKAPDAEDKAAARELLQAGKKKKKKKVGKVPFYRTGWFQAAGLAAILAAAALVLFLVFRPAGADTLYKHISAQVTSKDPARRQAAFEGPIQEYLRRFGDRDDEPTRKVKAWAEEIGVEQAEARLDDIRHKVKKGFSIDAMDALTEADRDAFRAVQAEEKGDLAEAVRLWNVVGTKHADTDRYLAALAVRRWKQYAEAEGHLHRFAGHYAYLKNRLKEPEVSDDVERKAFFADRYRRFGDLFESYRLWTALREELEKKPEKRSWYLLAASQGAAVKAQLPVSVKDEEGARLENIDRQLSEVDKLKKAGTLREAEMLCREVEALYGSNTDKDFKAKVKAAEDKRGKLRDD